jgi:hypothetical protein
MIIRQQSTDHLKHRKYRDHGLVIRAEMPELDRI